MKVIVGVLALIAIVNAASIQWTGYAGNNQWTTNNNWYPNTVPGPNDDVTIAKGIVEVTIPTGVNSLVMGTDVDNAANLTLYHAFAVGSAGLTVHGNGNLILQSGLEPVTGPVYIDGTFTYNVGVASGPWSISSKGTAYLKGNGQKVFYGAQFVAQGSIYIDGIIALNASSTFLVKGNAQIDTGLQVLLADKNPGSVFDTTAGSLSLNAGLLSLQAPCNIGTLNIAAGANVNAYSGVVFSQPLSVPSGSVVATFGDANVTFSGAVTGAGSLAAGGRLTSINACNISTLTVNGVQHVLSCHKRCCCRPTEHCWRDCELWRCSPGCKLQHHCGYHPGQQRGLRVLCSCKSVDKGSVAGRNAPDHIEHVC